VEFVCQSVKKTEKDHCDSSPQGSFVPSRWMHAVEAACGKGAVGNGVQYLVQAVDCGGKIFARGVGKKEYDGHDKRHGQKSQDHGKKVDCLRGYLRNPVG
jgi:hypothetical protein